MRRQNAEFLPAVPHRTHTRNRPRRMQSAPSNPAICPPHYAYAMQNARQRRLGAAAPALTPARQPRQRPRRIDIQRRSSLSPPTRSSLTHIVRRQPARCRQLLAYAGAAFFLIWRHERFAFFSPPAARRRRFSLLIAPRTIHARVHVRFSTDANRHVRCARAQVRRACAACPAKSREARSSTLARPSFLRVREDAAVDSVPPRSLSPDGTTNAGPAPASA